MKMHEERKDEQGKRRLDMPVVLIVAALLGLGCSGTSPTAPNEAEGTLEVGEPVATAWQVVDGHLIGTWERVAVPAPQDFPEILPIDNNRLVVVRPTPYGGGNIQVYIYDHSTELAMRKSSRFPWTSTNTIIWTGTKVFIGPGNNNNFPPPTQPITYDPATDTWEQVTIDLKKAETAMRAGDGRGVWTGSEIVYFAAGLTLDPERGTWRTIARFPLNERIRAAVVWTGKELIVWGGCDASIYLCATERQGLFTDGAIYSPSSDGWRLMAPSPLPAGAIPAVAWAATEAIFYAGLVDEDTSIAASYDPESDEWTTLPTPPIRPRRGIGLAWSSDTGMLFAWGGSTNPLDPDSARLDGAALDVSTMTWLHLPEPDTPPKAARSGHAVATIGDTFYVDGGSPAFGPMILKPQ